jgi:regulator of replication initiation timing
MILRNFVKKTLGLCENKYAEGLQANIRVLEKNVSDWKGQANVDATENLFLVSKLKKIREVMGNDDRCFSKFTRSQIEDMSIEEFRAVESEIDKDVLNGKLFLR